MSSQIPDQPSYIESEDDPVNDFYAPFYREQDIQNQSNPATKTQLPLPISITPRTPKINLTIKKDTLISNSDSEYIKSIMGKNIEIDIEKFKGLARDIP